MSSSSGVAEGFEIEFYYCCAAPYRLEQRIHKHLDKYRVNSKREFFDASIEIIEQAFYDMAPDLVVGDIKYCRNQTPSSVITNPGAVARFQQDIQNRKDTERLASQKAVAERVALLNKQRRKTERNDLNARIASGRMAERIDENTQYRTYNYPLDTIATFIFVTAIVFSVYFLVIH